MNNEIEISQSYESLPQAVEALCLKVFGAKPMYLCGMWGDTTTQNEEIRVQQRQIKALCEENQSLREDYENVRDALLRAAKWGIRSDGFSAEVSDALRMWVDAGMIGDPPEVPSYYPQQNS